MLITWDSISLFFIFFSYITVLKTCYEKLLLFS
jgi:hypothetical protein